jgi:hypothetical protein
MRKAFLIAAGTVTGLGAVLSITPPAMSDSVGTIGMPAVPILVVAQQRVLQRLPPHLAEQLTVHHLLLVTMAQSV